MEDHGSEHFKKTHHNLDTQTSLCDSLGSPGPSGPDFGAPRPGASWKVFQTHHEDATPERPGTSAIWSIPIWLFGEFSKNLGGWGGKIIQIWWLSMWQPGVPILLETPFDHLDGKISCCIGISGLPCGRVSNRWWNPIWWNMLNMLQSSKPWRVFLLVGQKLLKIFPSQKGGAFQ